MLSLIFGYMYVYNEDNVYIYDYVGYYLRCDYLSGIFKNGGLFQGLKYLIETIRTSDYNSFPILFITPFFLLIKNSRLVYILSLIFLYLVPTMISILFLISKEFKIRKNYVLFITMVIFVFCFTNFWSGLLRGLPDIIGIIPLILCYNNAINNNIVNKISLHKLIIYGIVAYLPFLCRRWYLFSVVSYYISILIIGILQIILTKDGKKKIKNLIFNMFIEGITTLGCVFLLQTPLALRILKESYSSSYSAYQVSFLNHFINFYNEFGLIIILLSIIGIIFGLKKKNKQILYSFLNVIFFWILFTRIQGMGVHHYLGISFYLLILSLYGIYYIYSFIKNKKIKIVFLIIINILVMINFSTTFIFRDKKIPIISQNTVYYKFRYEHYDELLRFKQDLSNLISTNYGKVSFFASNDNISDSLIDTIGDDIIKSNLYYTSNIDLRDGLNINSLLYRYVVVSDKTQVGTSESGQQVLVHPNTLIINKEEIGNSYKQVLGPYLLQGNINVYVYEKIKPLMQDDIKNYLNYFFKLYPDWKKDVTLFDESILNSKILLGDKLGDFKRLDNDTYYIHPGYTSTIVSTVMDKNVRKLKLNFYTEKNIPDNDDYGVVQLLIKNGKKIIYDGVVTKDNNKIIDIDFSNDKNFYLEVNYGDSFNYDALYIDYIVN